ncbi:MAG: hypothetical protein GY844_18825 [Bradyrhizobium sp.]|nr:hypothetical protein [Bradyrhizobium sp.]
MTLGEVGTWASTAGTVIAAIYAILTYHARKGATMSSPSAFSQKAAQFVSIPTWRPVAVIAFCALIAWGAVLYDKVTQGNELPDTYVEGWTASPPVYLMQVNAKPLLRFKDDFKLMTLARVNFVDRDPMTDTVIEKSGLYTITGSTIPIGFNTSNVLRFAPLQPNGIQLFLLLIPKNYSPDNIKALGDVEKINGKILTVRGQTIIGGPPDEQQQALQPK